MSRVKRWCFTLNNYTEDEYSAFLPRDATGARTLPPILDYIVVGKEIGTFGTPHLQGFLSFCDRSRIAACKRLSSRAHWEVARSVERAIDYCKKDGDFLEFGDKPSESKQGRRSDLESFKEAVKSGIRDVAQLREDFSTVCAQYPRFVESYLRDQHSPPIFQDHPLHSWQQDVVDLAMEEPDGRTICFVVDKLGNTGKSWLATYMELNVNKSVQVIRPGKFADMAYGYLEETEVVILDCPRSKQGDFIQYDFLEALKDGRLFSMKYESRMKRFTPPHVFVFMNEDPDMDKLSPDRYVFINPT